MQRNGFTNPQLYVGYHKSPNCITRVARVAHPERPVRFILANIPSSRKCNYGLMQPMRHEVMGSLKTVENERTRQRLARSSRLRTARAGSRTELPRDFTSRANESERPQDSRAQAASSRASSRDGTARSLPDQAASGSALSHQACNAGWVDAAPFICRANSS